MKHFYSNLSQKIKSSIAKGFTREGILKAGVFMGVVLFSCASIYAQSKGSAGFTTATTEISGYQEPLKKLMYAIASVIAIVGAFNVYFKMQNGDQDVKKTIMMTIGGCVAFIALAQALPMFFQ